MQKVACPNLWNRCSFRVGILTLDPPPSVNTCCRHLWDQLMLTVDLWEDVTCQTWRLYLHARRALFCIWTRECNPHLNVFECVTTPPARFTNVTFMGGSITGASFRMGQISFAGVDVDEVITSQGHTYTNLAIGPLAVKPPLPPLQIL